MGTWIGVIIGSVLYKTIHLFPAINVNVVWDCCLVIRKITGFFSSEEVVMGVCHDEEVSLYHAFYDVQCSERCLCI